jgi:hypothetical protein
MPAASVSAWRKTRRDFLLRRRVNLSLERIMADKLEDLLFALEEQFWLGSSDYYRGNLADAALVVFPDPAGVQIKDEILSSVSGSPAGPTWPSRHQGEPRPYRARASSAYVREGRAWKLAFHQQTPLV